MKKLKHPAIPIVYDLEEDQEYLYLVEEYLQGTSLYTLIHRQGVFSQAEAVRFGIQLCQLVQFLHSAGETPILHLDLQPNNLMICGGTVKIIDFGQAAFEDAKEGEGEARCAVRGFASPEQYISGQDLDVRADIYAIGAILSFMVCKSPVLREADGRISRELCQVISRCMEPDREKRFSSARQVERSLWPVLNSGRPDSCEDRMEDKPLTVAVAGSRAGAGATHLALALNWFLSRRGLDALYIEQNQSGHMRCLAEMKGIRPDERGLYQLGGCRIRPWYGETVSLQPVKASITICDYGCEWRQMYGRGNDILLMAAGPSPWEWWDLERMMEALRPEIRCGMGSFLVFRERGGRPSVLRPDRRTYRELAIFRQPCYPDPMAPDLAGEGFLEELWRAVSRKAGIKSAEGGRRWHWGKGGKSMSRVLGDRSGKADG